MSTKAQIYVIATFALCTCALGIYAFSLFTFPLSLLPYPFCEAGTSTTVERALQISHFIQNKANFPDTQMNVKTLHTKDYENKTLSERGKNKPNTKPIQTQSNPITEKAEMNVTSIITKGYENKPHCWTKSKQTQFKPKQTQSVVSLSSLFQRQKMLLCLTIPYYNAGNTTIELLQRYNDMSAACSRLPILVLGIGNILLRDEGVGVRVIEQMQGIPLPDNVELVDGGTAGADLLDVLAERRKVIVIDAVQADCEPGTVLRFSADDLVRPDRVGISLHELGLGEALAMTRQLGCAPKEVVVFGIKPRDISCGLELSEEIAASVPRVVELVLAEIANARRHPFLRNDKSHFDDGTLAPEKGKFL